MTKDLKGLTVEGDLSLSNTLYNDMALGKYVIRGGNPAAPWMFKKLASNKMLALGYSVNRKRQPCAP